MIDEKINEYIATHPQECLRLLVIAIALAWQSVAAVLGIALYVLLAKHFRLQWWMTLSLGLLLAIPAVLLQQYFNHIDLAQFIHQGFSINFIFWKKIFQGHTGSALLFAFNQGLNFVLALPLLMAGILSAIDLISNNPHKAIMKSLQQGIEVNEKPEVSNKVIDKAMKKLREEDHDGTVLGVSKYTGQYVVLPDKDINQVALVLGTTGSGKTITLRRFYQRAIRKGYPLIIIDGKPHTQNVEWLMSLAEQYDRGFIGFNCGNYLSYDCLANGGFTELKDKIISLKDEWSSDHYRSIAEDYLQATFQVLKKIKNEFDLKEVVNCLNYDELANLAQKTEDDYLIQRVSALECYDKNDITGLQAHLNILIHSELGEYFHKNEKTFTLSKAIQEGAVVYFALPALRFPSFSKVLGKLVINDLKAVIDRNLESNKKIFTVFDEFSVFAGDQVLNLVNMGREKGVHAIFGTQGLADLEKVDVTFKNQVLNCVNTLICHRLNDQESAESIASWVGTKDVFTVTAQLNMKQGDAAMGSVRRGKEFIIHPDHIKQGLQTGEAFYITKAGKFWKDKVKIKLV